MGLHLITNGLRRIFVLTLSIAFILSAIHAEAAGAAMRSVYSTYRFHAVEFHRAIRLDDRVGMIYHADRLLDIQRSSVTKTAGTSTTQLSQAYYDNSFSRIFPVEKQAALSTFVDKFSGPTPTAIADLAFEARKALSEALLLPSESELDAAISKLATPQIAMGKEIPLHPHIADANALAEKMSPDDFIGKLTAGAANPAGTIDAEITRWNAVSSENVELLRRWWDTPPEKRYIILSSGQEYNFVDFIDADLEAKGYVTLSYQHFSPRISAEAIGAAMASTPNHYFTDSARSLDNEMVNAERDLSRVLRARRPVNPGADLILSAPVTK